MTKRTKLNMLDSDEVAAFAGRLGLAFADLDLLQMALRHRSVVVELTTSARGGPVPESNERLEFLGDAVLGFVVAEELYRNFPGEQEGSLTPRRAAMVRTERLVAWAREIDLGSMLVLGTGEKVTEGVRDRMLAGAFEALLGAIYLDQGIDAVLAFLHPYIQRTIHESAALIDAANAKGRLQEVIQDRFRQPPTYSTLTAEGRQHALTFSVQVSLGDRVLGTGTGTSKREAEQAAARDALARLEAENLD